MIEEVEEAIRATKSDKRLGKDQTVAEHYTHLSNIAIKYTILLFNNITYMPVVKSQKIC